MNNFNLNETIGLLSRTPVIFHSWFEGLSENWVTANEGEGTWSAYDIIGHLIHGELTDWIPRMEIITGDQPDKSFIPFDRFAQFENSKGKTMSDLLKEFQHLRILNLSKLEAKKLTPEILSRTGIHPEFGEVTLQQLLSTWVAHDLNHISQTARVMAKRYTTDIGPWIAYLRVFQQ